MIVSGLTRREFARLLGCGLPAVAAARCAARSAGGPNFVGVIEKVSPSVVAVGNATQTLGSGFVVRPNLVITAAHVAQAAGTNVAIALGSTRRGARLVGMREEDDLAALEISESLAPLRLGSQSPRVGEWIVVIGNPFGAGTTATAGIVSAIPGAITASPQLARQIQINASVNPGNSGGPVCNLSGEVVGATTTLVAAGQGIAFATSAALIASFLTSLSK
jgi:serine protease Do